MYNVFLDDERPVPDGWKGVKTASEAIKLLQTGLVSAISLDHDLGHPDAGTGYDVACWIEQEYLTIRNMYRQRLQYTLPIPLVEQES